MEFYEHTLGAVARLLWTYPGQVQQPIPQNRLYPGAAGNGTGLKAEYFNNISLIGVPMVNRVDQQVDFTWNAASPATGINADNFSVRWTGQIEAPVTGNYVFSTVSDDGVRLWINGAQVINNWTDHAPTVNNSAAIPLAAGTRYDIRMEFYEHTLGAVSRLLWAYPGQAQQPVPQSRLYPAATSLAASVPPAGLAETATPSTIEDSDVLVYPNPVNDMVNVVINSNTSGEVGISIQSSFSQQRIEEYFKLSEGENHFAFPVHDLRNGLYVFTINQAGQKIVRRIMIDR